MKETDEERDKRIKEWEDFLAHESLGNETQVTKAQELKTAAEVAIFAYVLFFAMLLALISFVNQFCNILEKYVALLKSCILSQTLQDPLQSIHLIVHPRYIFQIAMNSFK